MRPMIRRALGLSLVLLVGCHGPAKDYATLDIADPALAPGWVQFRHEPGGYAFQAPSSWVVDSQPEALQLMARTKSDLNLWLRIADLDAGRKGDMVTFTVTRLSFPADDELKVMNLDEYGKKALKGMSLNMPDAKHERLALPIGAAEHVWGTMDKVHADGRRERLTSHMVVFATALRPFMVVYGYPTAKEAEYRPTLDAIVRTMRLFLPKKDGMVQIPATAHFSQSTFPPPSFSGSVNPNTVPPTGPTSPSTIPVLPSDPLPNPQGPPQSEPMPPPSSPAEEQAPTPNENPPSAEPTTGGAASTGDPSGVPPSNGP